MDKIDLETKNGVNCVTRWADRANDDFQRAQAAGGPGEANLQKPGEDKDKAVPPEVARAPVVAQGRETATVS